MTDPVSPPIADPFDPYAAPQSPLATAQVATDELEPADRATRLGALLIDGLLLYGGLFIVPVAMVAWTMIARDRPPDIADYMFALDALWVVGLTATQLWLLHRHGQTLGKRWLHLRVVRTDGRRAGLLRLVGLRVLSLLPLLLPMVLLGPLWLGSIWAPLGYLVPALTLSDAAFIFRADRRCLHDRMADTVVVHA